MKPLIGILSNITSHNEDKILGIERIFTSKTYVNAVEKSGGVPLIIPVNTDKENIKRQIQVLDGVIISGGVDVNPILYNEEPVKELGNINPDIDEFDIIAIKTAIELNKPILGICRGLQVINVSLGGSLYQDISYANSFVKHFQDTKSYIATHQIEIDKDSILYEVLGEKAFVNSYHHQSIKDLGERLEIIAYSKDGIVEAVQSKSSNFILGVQWHPEMMADYDKKMMDLFKLFINKTK